jgi:tetrahydromethanopterin S-methyltransferase subunit G
MFGIPEWAVGVAVIITAAFAGIGLMVRILPPKMRHPRPQELAQDQQERLEDLERRLGEVEHVQSRLAEIEERLDFTERLLATRRDADRLSPPSA